MATQKLKNPKMREPKVLKSKKLPKGKLKRGSKLKANKLTVGDRFAVPGTAGIYIVEAVGASQNGTRGVLAKAIGPLARPLFVRNNLTVTLVQDV